MDQREPKRHRSANYFVDEDQKPRMFTSTNAPAPYMEPPPRYEEMVATHAARNQEYLALVEQRNKLFSDHMSYIYKDIDTKEGIVESMNIDNKELMNAKIEPIDTQEDLEKSMNIDNKDLMNIRIEPVKIEPVVVIGEGSSQANSSMLRRIIKCCICKGAPATMVLLPCRHLCVCSNCAEKAQSCPVCGTNKFYSSRA